MAAVNTSSAPNAPSSINSNPDQSEPESVTIENMSNTPPSVRSSLSWRSFRSSMTLSEKTSSHLGWLIAFLSVLCTVVALSPAFKSQGMSEKALKLAEWTALKDYIEECRDELAAGIQSQACLKAIGAELPPPPYVKPGVLDNIRRTLVQVDMKNNGTSRGRQVVHPGVYISRTLQGLAFLAVILTACVFVFLGFENRIRRRAYATRSYGKEEDELMSSHPPAREPEALTTTIRHPPNAIESTARRRNIRVHPIYRHANLEEAIHHEDISEIRLRLQNGEDVNIHWPYLIYKLAITPPTRDTPKQLEIAQLCLDFGADVNALKGWNGQSALMIAIHFGNVDVAKLLIINGATVWYAPADSNLTALHRCVRLAVTGPHRDALEIMNMLFEYGAEPNQTDRAGETALHKLLIDAWLKRDNKACMRKLVPVALCLVEHGAYLPETIKEKYIVSNPLWDVVNSVMFKTEWPRDMEPNVWL